MTLAEWLRHAFAVDNTPVEPTLLQAEMIDRLAREVVRRGMTIPALAFLEMSQPLHFVAAQALIFFQPILSTLFDSARQQAFAEFLEQRGSVGFLCRAIERISAEDDPLTASTGARRTGAAGSARVDD
jgi:hypothetical protein